MQRICPLRRPSPDLSVFAKTETKAGDSSARGANFFSIIQNMVLCRCHPGSVRASSGGHQPERWSWERRLRAGLKSPALGRPREPPPDTTIRPDAFRGGRGSPPAGKTPRWSAERRALPCPFRGGGSAERLGEVFRRALAGLANRKGTTLKGAARNRTSVFSALRSLTHACIVGSVSNCSSILRCAGCLTS